MKRFWDKVDKSGSCWIWTASKNPEGYGHFKVEGAVVAAHRFVLRLMDISIPVGSEVLHACDTPSCVNPDHLVIGTHRDNMTDMVNKGRSRGAIGERNYHSKLTDEQVTEIRQKYSDRKTSTSVIAKLYGVSQPMISYILIGKNWRTA